MTQKWPPNYVAEAQRRCRLIDAAASDPQLARLAYATDPISFIQDWCYTVDPRKAGTGTPAWVPFVLFQRQIDYINFLLDLMTHQISGLVEKSRDIGATWCSCGFAVWLWLYRDNCSVGFGSRKEMLVDRRGDMDSIFEKLRSIIRDLPAYMLPEGYNDKKHATYMKIINPANGASITGEAGDEIGRGGRKLIYFKDEAAHYERAESIEAALMDNTNIQVDISSVNGTGNVFHRRRQGGEIWHGNVENPTKTQVFIFDWRDHPAKTQSWYDARRQRSEDDGLLAKFAQEVDRDYSASVTGVVVPALWIEAAVGFAEDFEIDVSGKKLTAMDVADDTISGDKNALCHFYGIECRHVESWGQVDTVVSANRAVSRIKEFGATEFQYDSIGVGAGVKGQMNQLKRQGALPDNLKTVGWVASGKVRNPHGKVVSGDVLGIKNKDFFANFKAQAWWAVRGRFYETYKCRQGLDYDEGAVISISRDIPVSIRHQIVAELSQPTRSETSAGKMLIDKSPNGAASPNLADAFVIGAYPATANQTKTEQVFI